MHSVAVKKPTKQAFFQKETPKYATKTVNSGLETGLYYYGARYLDPKTSRWISADPAMGEYIPVAPINEEAKKHNQNLPGMGGIFNLVNMHTYHYAGNNPVTLTDPDGRWPKKIHRYILEKAFENELKSGEITQAQLEIMIKAGEWIDSSPNQTPERSYLHSMTDGTKGQTKEEAMELRNEFVSREIENFASATDMDKAFEHLGFALHPISDEDAPPHNWEAWSGYGFLGIKGLKHLFREGKNNPDEINASIEKVRSCYQEAMQLRNQKQQE